MKTVFEYDAGSELTQVALWTAYRSQFDAVGLPPLLAAADVIKASTEAFPQATPTVVEAPERKFVIKGMRIRDRTGKHRHGDATCRARRD